MKHTTTVTYLVSVRGEIWSGHRASMQYTFAFEPDKQAILCVTGDFAVIHRYKVEQVTTVTCTDHALVSCGVNLSR